MFCVSAGRRARDDARAKRVQRRVLERQASRYSSVAAGCAVCGSRWWYCCTVSSRWPHMAMPCSNQRPDQATHPSNATSEPTRRLLLLVGLAQELAVCAQGDGACGWMTLPAMLAPSTSTWRCSIRSTLAFAFVQRSKLKRQHRALLA